MERQPIDRSFNVAVRQCANRLFPTGFDVSPDAPSTLADLQDHVRRLGRLCVWDGGSGQTSFADPETNYAFRAWHDHCHLRGPHDFTPAGEAAALAEQKRDLTKLYGADHPSLAHWLRLLDIEVMGQLAYSQQHGDFPADQWQFTRDALDALA